MCGVYVSHHGQKTMRAQRRVVARKQQQQLANEVQLVARHCRGPGTQALRTRLMLALKRLEKFC